MLDAREVANYLIRVGYSPDEEADSLLLNPLRLQKLLYYVQGWTLGLLGRPLFHQDIEAWAMGPVVRDVYGKYAGRSDPIRPDPTERVASLSETEKSLIEMVWKEYVSLSPGQLIRMTHSERPWLEARGGLKEGDPSDAVISKKTMEEFFGEEARRLAAKSTTPGFPTLDPIEAWRSEERAELGNEKGIPAEEAFAELLAKAR